jgi:hypothetical protein
MLLVSEYGAEQVHRDPVRARLTDPRRQARHARAQAASAREQAAKLRGLPPVKAAALIESQRAAEQAAQAAPDRVQRLRRLPDPAPSPAESRRDSPDFAL